MGRNGRWLLAALALAAPAVADDALVERWDHPRRETFDMKEAWPRSVAEEISKRYGVPFGFDIAFGADRTEFAAKDVTFFEALDRFAVSQGLGVAGAPSGKGGDEGTRPLALVRPEKPLRPAPAAYVGAGRLSVQSVSVISVASFAAGEDDDVPLRFTQETAKPTLRLRLRWLTESGFDDVALVACDITAAEDDLGGHLRPAGEDGSAVPANRDFVIEFEPPSRKVKAIRKLEGKVRVALPLERGKVEFLAGEVGKTKPLGGAQVTLDGIDAETKMVSFTVKGASCAGCDCPDPDLEVGAEDCHIGWSANAFTVCPYDAEGRLIERGQTTEIGRWSWGRQWNGKVELRTVPARVSFEALVRAAVREAPFAFADVPLPE